MPEIYKNAVVTISAASALDCNQGFLDDRADILLSARQTLRLPVLANIQQNLVNKSQITYQESTEIFLARDTDLGFKIKDFEEEHINTRAWTLQESWLSLRLLIYGSGPPKWQCLTKQMTYGADFEEKPYRFEKGKRKWLFEGQAEDSFGETDQVAVKAGTASVKVNKGALLQEWHSLFIDFNRRNITYRTDRFPAISGIAREFGNKLGEEYVAGLWASTLPHSLLWEHNNNCDSQHAQARASGGGKSREKVKSVWSKARAVWKGGSGEEGSGVSAAKAYIAPSWSPFHNPRPVILAHQSSKPEWTLATVHSYSTTLVNADAPYGSINDGRIEITAPMRQLSYRQIVSLFVIVTVGALYMYWDYIIPDNGADNPYLGPAARLQMKHPELNPAVLVDFPLEVRRQMKYPEFNPAVLPEQLMRYLLINGPLPKDIERATPPDRSHISFPPSLSAQNGKNREGPDAEFWLLEIRHTGVPAGLVLVRLFDNVFKRIGMFHMGKDLDPNFLWVNGICIAGPREWSWDALLEIRRCMII